MIVERMRLNTQRLTTIRLEEPGLSNVWWPFALDEDDADNEKILALWLNSTLGMILMFSYRVPTEGPFIQFKKPSLSIVPVLDPRSLASAQKKILVDAYDDVCRKNLGRLSEAGSDTARMGIDKAMQEALELPNIETIRQLFADEPVITAKPLY